MRLLARADALHIPLASGSVQCVVTSPPYRGLRDYGTAVWVGGAEDCDHIARRPSWRSSTLGPKRDGPGPDICRQAATRLSAWQDVPARTKRLVVPDAIALLGLAVVVSAATLEEENEHGIPRAGP